MTTEYENYTETSQHYDRTRRTVGIPFLTDVLMQLSAELGPISLLDAGCGTGSCIHALREKAGQIEGVDLNEGMLLQAKKRLDAHKHVRVQKASLTDLPFSDNSFHVIICNQVLHHLNDEESALHDYPTMHEVFREFQRLLVPGGGLIINTSSHRQLADGFWWAALIPEAVQRISKRFPDIDTLTELLSQYDFEIETISIPYDEVLQQENYLNPEGPLNAAHRDGDSTWSLASKNELDSAISKVTTMLADTSMPEYLKEREALRLETGQTTFLYLKKKNNSPSSPKAN
jgi:ubiquinone/menaquinone biosynthesis C-methylase UbiE